MQWYNKILLNIITLLLYLELDECCYSYASVPRNDTFCVPEGELVILSCIIINPHDSFINLTVTWLRSTTEDTSIFDEIPATSEEYEFSTFISDNSLISVINCSHEAYRDSFSLAIFNFTRHKNGYYWCQLFINNTLVQPSHQAHFFVGDCNITNQGYYRLANLRLGENRCAKYVVTESNAGLTTKFNYESPRTFSFTSSRELIQITKQNVATKSDAESSTRLSSGTQQDKENERLIIYIIGNFSALLLIALLGVLALALSFASYVKEKDQ